MTKPKTFSCGVRLEDYPNLMDEDRARVRLELAELARKHGGRVIEHFEGDMERNAWFEGFPTARAASLFGADAEAVAGVAFAEAD